MSRLINLERALRLAAQGSPTRSLPAMCFWRRRTLVICPAKCCIRMAEAPWAADRKQLLFVFEARESAVSERASERNRSAAKSRQGVVRSRPSHFALKRERLDRGPFGGVVARGMR